jgi:hypothetical protein
MKRGVLGEKDSTDKAPPTDAEGGAEGQGQYRKFGDFATALVVVLGLVDVLGLCREVVALEGITMRREFSLSFGY